MFEAMLSRWRASRRRGGCGRTRSRIENGWYRGSGAVNRIKMIRRQMYGPAKPDFLLLD